MGFGHYKYDESISGSSPYNERRNEYLAGLFVRQYKKLANKFYFFGELGAGYFGADEIDTYSLSNSQNEQKLNGLVLGISPGVSYDIYKKLHVELSVPSMLSLLSTTNKITSGSNSSSEQQFSFNTNFSQNSFLNSIGLGFTFIF